ncbi:MAG TPA: hypothetical protein VMT23_03575 [Candidatus Binatia bacterium]|nr:hypothetical protein [Candidatus Binatia bacterium]
MDQTKRRSGFEITASELSAEAGTQVLKISGKRFGQPTKRFTLHGPKLDVVSVKITHANKNKLVEYQVDRINYLPTRGQTRIHCSSLLYPGNYELVLKIKGADDIGSVDKLFGQEP